MRVAANYYSAGRLFLDRNREHRAGRGERAADSQLLGTYNKECRFRLRGGAWHRC